MLSRGSLLLPVVAAALRPTVRMAASATATETVIARCFCGAITVTVSGAPAGTSACHCGTCRSLYARDDAQTPSRLAYSLLTRSRPTPRQVRRALSRQRAVPTFSCHARRGRRHRGDHGRHADLQNRDEAEMRQVLLSGLGRGCSEAAASRRSSGALLAATIRVGTRSPHPLRKSGAGYERWSAQVPD